MQITQSKHACDSYSLDQNTGATHLGPGVPLYHGGLSYIIHQTQTPCVKLQLYGFNMTEIETSSIIWVELPKIGVGTPKMDGANNGKPY